MTWVKFGPVFATLVVGLAGCGSEPSPSGPSVTVSAPSLLSPVSSAQVTTDQPTLTVGNATASDGSSLTYTFQVASDSGFAQIVASNASVPEGAGGQTSWRVTTALGNSTYYWRARARSGATDGPFSGTGDFNVFTAFRSTTARQGLLVFDPLTVGYSVGVQIGGEFTPQGWKVIARSNSIIYDVPTVSAGFVEFDVTNLTLRNISPDSRMLFIMWDTTESDFTENRYRVSLQKLDRRSSINTRYIRLRFISQGRQIDESNSFIDWVPTTVYHWRIEWGQSGQTNVRVYLNGTEIISGDYLRVYNPASHRIELGAAPRAESLEDAIFSNVRIGVEQ